MEIGAYFTTLQWILMGSVFISIALIFLHGYYGRDEEPVEE